MIKENGLKESQTTDEVFRDDNAVSVIVLEDNLEFINRVDEEKTLFLTIQLIRLRILPLN